MSTPFRVGSTHSADTDVRAPGARFAVSAQRIPGEDVPFVAQGRLTEPCTGAVAGFELGADAQSAGPTLIQVGDGGRSRARGLLVE
jgi:hypothetical protein